MTSRTSKRAGRTDLLGTLIRRHHRTPFPGPPRQSVPRVRQRSRDYILHGYADHRECPLVVQDALCEGHHWSPWTTACRDTRCCTAGEPGSVVTGRSLLRGRGPAIIGGFYWLAFLAKQPLEQPYADRWVILLRCVLYSSGADPAQLPSTRPVPLQQPHSLPSESIEPAVYELRAKRPPADTFDQPPSRSRRLFQGGCAWPAWHFPCVAPRISVDDL